MYTPTAFSETDRAVLQAFIEQHPFAVLVSVAEAEPTATHIPLLFERQQDRPDRLVGHFARANSQWRTADGQRVMVIFSGPHAYVSPAWYGDRDVVPTWNYVTVHAYGTLRVVEDRGELWRIIRTTVERFESELQKPWSLEQPSPEFLERLIGGIVGFEIVIERLEGKWKLGQNQDPQRRTKVAQKLTELGGEDRCLIAELMLATLRGTEFTNP